METNDGTLEALKKEAVDLVQNFRNYSLPEGCKRAEPSELKWSPNNQLGSFIIMVFELGSFTKQVSINELMLKP